MLGLSTAYFPLKSVMWSPHCITSITYSVPNFATPRAIFAIPHKVWRAVANSPTPSRYAITASHSRSASPRDARSSRTSCFAFTALSTTYLRSLRNASHSSMSIRRCLSHASRFLRRSLYHN